MKPPRKIDGANVLEWAWSGDIPFGVINYTEGDLPAIEIFALAICQYDKSNDIYRFSCNKNWETEQDGVYASVEEAKENLPEQYKNVPTKWILS